MTVDRVKRAHISLVNLSGLIVLLNQRSFVIGVHPGLSLATVNARLALNDGRNDFDSQ